MVNYTAFKRKPVVRWEDWWVIGCVSVDSLVARAGRIPRDHLVPHVAKEEAEALKSPKIMQLLSGYGLQTRVS